MLALMAAAAWIVTGSVSDNPHQHMIDGARAKQAAYVDLEDGGQIVAYSKEPLPEGKRLRLTGAEFLAEGRSKRPGDKRKVTEKQLVVETIEVLPSIEELIQKLPASRKELVEAKKAAIPALIARLPDKEAEWTLYEIVEPPLREQKIAAMAPESDQKISIDWKPWWEKNHQKSLRTIQTELLPYVNEYWKSGGKTQKVPSESEP